jgi:formamidopyrimidine-DNA glycosylase
MLTQDRYKKKLFDNYNLIKQKLPIKVIDVKTKGKFIYIILENDIFIFNTLGLFGSWCYLGKNSKNFSFSQNLKDYSKYLSKEDIESYTKNVINHRNVEFKIKDGSLFFSDMLSFGTLKVVTDKNELEKKLKQIGPKQVKLAYALN